MAYDEDKNKNVDTGSLLIASLIISIMVCSYLIRELYPEGGVVQWFLGGSRILIFWVVAGYCIYKIDLKRLRKKNVNIDDMNNAKTELFSFKVWGIGLAAAILVIIAIKILL